MPSEDVQRHSVHTLVFRSLKRSHDMFMCDQGVLPPSHLPSEQLKRKIKSKDQYGPVLHRVAEAKKEAAKAAAAAASFPLSTEVPVNNQEIPETPLSTENTSSIDLQQSQALMPVLPGSGSNTTSITPGGSSQQVAIRKSPVMPKPKWHPPWKLSRVISGHGGWVRCIAVEPGNQWFCTGSQDRIIKIWDMATGQLKLSLTGHVSAVRGVAVSRRHPYLFSCGEDKQVKCWDLEYNKVIRHYHGHLSACFDMALHPTLDVLVTCGRDSTARVWDMRTTANIHTFTGHQSTVASVVCQAAEPQVITGSHDKTIRLWDLAAGKSMCTLTHHKKSVRAVALHPTLYMFASAGADNIKQWKCPKGEFVQSLTGHNSIINALAINSEGVMVSGANNGTMYFWDWRTGHNFQKLQAPVQPGSMDSEAGIYSMTFDESGSRLITCDADKTIKIYKEEETATEETHPVLWRPEILKRKKF